MIGYEKFIEIMLGTGALAMIGTFIVVWITIALAIYVYIALALMIIAQKLKYKNYWLAWIPIANIAMILQLGGFHWAWIFLIVVPIAGWLALTVLVIISMWRIYEKRNYPGWLSLILALNFVPLIGWIAGIANLVVLGLVAWENK